MEQTVTEPTSRITAIRTMIDLAIAIENADAKSHVHDMLEAAATAIGSQTGAKISRAVDLGHEPKQVLDWLTTYFFEDATRQLVLISDVPLCPDPLPSTGTLAKKCQSAIGQYAFGTIAITVWPQRIPDIDRTIRSDASRKDFERALTLAISRVQYLAAPSRAGSVDSRSISGRPLKSMNEGDFRSYFALRYRVYTIMGYLDEDMERCRSGLEINEADLHAIHLGAFYRTGPQEKLVGTARIVTNDEANMALQRVFEGLVPNDPIVRQRLNTPYPLTLPIFQSCEEMNTIMKEIYGRSQRCGEISRVIVDREFRGTGISRALMAEALRRSIDGGVERVFLECLKVHERLYGTYGFRPIAVGQVIDVYRTMVAMELQSAAVKKAAATQSSGEEQLTTSYKGQGTV